MKRPLSVKTGTCLAVAVILFLVAPLGRAEQKEQKEAEEQAIAHSFSELVHRVSVGDTVYVTDQAGEKVKGKIDKFSVETASVTLMVEGESVNFSQDEVWEIDLQYRDSLINGLLIGAVIGGVLGGIGDYLGECTSESGATCGAGALFAGGLGAAVGLGLDYARKGRRLVYSAPNETVQLQIGSSQRMFEKRTGIYVSIRF